MGTYMCSLSSTSLSLWSTQPLPTGGKQHYADSPVLAKSDTVFKKIHISGSCLPKLNLVEFSPFYVTRNYKGCLQREVRVMAGQHEGDTLVLLPFWTPGPPCTKVPKQLCIMQDSIPQNSPSLKRAKTLSWGQGTGSGCHSARWGQVSSEIRKENLVRYREQTVLLTWEGGALEIMFWQLEENQADLGWTQTNIEKKTKKGKDCSKPNEHTQIKKKAESGEELSFFCCFFWTGLNSIQTCGQKFQTLVQNIGNYWPKQSFTFLQLFPWFGSSWSAGTHSRTDKFTRHVKQGSSQSFHTSMIKWGVWPVSCWTERPQLPQPLQFIQETTVQLLHIRLWHVSRFFSVHWFSFSPPRS